MLSKTTRDILTNYPSLFSKVALRVRASIYIRQALQDRPTLHAELPCEVLQSREVNDLSVCPIPNEVVDR